MVPWGRLATNSFVPSLFSRQTHFPNPSLSFPLFSQDRFRLWCHPWSPFLHPPVTSSSCKCLMKNLESSTQTFIPFSFLTISPLFYPFGITGKLPSFSSTGGFFGGAEKLLTTDFPAVLISTYQREDFFDRFSVFPLLLRLLRLGVRGPSGVSSASYSSKIRRFRRKKVSPPCSPFVSSASLFLSLCPI